MAQLRYAVALGSYGLPQFIELNIRQCRRIFGEGVDILVSDDRSAMSDTVQIACNRLGVDYWAPKVAQGHFGGDMQNMLNGLVFAKVRECDVVVKLSQRFVLLDPSLVGEFDQVFSGGKVDVALPGRPSYSQIKGGHKMFGNMPVLTDILLLRVGAVDPSEILAFYANQMRVSTDFKASYIEILWWNLIQQKFNGRHAILRQLTDHEPFRRPRFLRRYTNNPKEYADLARSLGMGGKHFPLEEWKRMSKRYSPHPRGISI